MLLIGVFRDGFQKISKAKDGLREAHMDVLVAFFWKPSLNMPDTNPRRHKRKYAGQN
ncbi:hypothetical protein ABIE59_002696 [Marinobacter sp. MBR-99]|jgi:hypothetical protein